MNKPMRALLRALQKSQLTLIDTASKTQSKMIANLCYSLATRRGKFAAELAPQESLRDESLGEASPFDAASMSRLRSILRGGNVYLLLGELTRRDLRLIDQYRDALEALRAERVAPRLREQLAALSAEHDRLKAVRDLHAPPTY